MAGEVQRDDRAGIGGMQVGGATSGVVEHDEGPARTVGQAVDGQSLLTRCEEAVADAVRRDGSRAGGEVPSRGGVQGRGIGEDRATSGQTRSVEVRGQNVGAVEAIRAEAGKRSAMASARKVKAAR